jgi:2,3-dihydroxybenzoate decarboxylase
MKVIAIEEHFSMDGLEGVPDLSSLPTPVDPKAMEHWDTGCRDFTQVRLPDMDANGVSVQVLSLTVPAIEAVNDPEVAVASAKTANDHLANVIAAHPHRFRGFAALPLQNPKAAADELRRCITDLHFCGALVNNVTGGHFLDEPQFKPVWQALADLDVPLYLHPGLSDDKWSILDGCPQLVTALWEWQARIGGHAMRLVLNGVFDRHPKARIILGHMGEFLPFQISRFDSRYLTLKEQKLSRAVASNRDACVSTAEPLVPPISLMVVGAAGFEPATSWSRIRGTPLSP